MMTRPQDLLRERRFCSLIIIIKNFKFRQQQEALDTQFDFTSFSFWLFLVLAFYTWGVLVEITIAAIVLYFWICTIFLDLTWHFCNHIVLLMLCCTQNYLTSKSNGDLSIVCHPLALIDKLHFSGCHTFQHCLNMLKLNKHAKCLSLSINS